MLSTPCEAARAPAVPPEVDRRGGRPSWLRLSFPTRWRYDVLSGLDYLRASGVTPNERVAEAIHFVEGNRNPDGRWPLQHVHAGESQFQMEDREGTPS